MASAVDICNLALSGLGDAAGVVSIDPPDNSVQARYCATYYPIALNSLLSRGWSFNTRRALLAEVTNPSLQWQFCLVIPADYISMIALLGDQINEEKSYSIEVLQDNTRVIFCNTQIADLVYYSSAVSPNNFSPLFVDALVIIMQYYLAGSIIKGDVGVAAKRGLMQQMQLAISLAQIDDARGDQPLHQYIPEASRAHSFSGATVSQNGDIVYVPLGFDVL